MGMDWIGLLCSVCVFMICMYSIRICFIYYRRFPCIFRGIEFRSFVRNIAKKKNVFFFFIKKFLINFSTLLFLLMYQHIGRGHGHGYLSKSILIFETNSFVNLSLLLVDSLYYAAKIIPQ